MIRCVLAGALVAAPAFLVTAQPGTATPVLRFEITAAGGYRQVVPARVVVSPPPPDYEPQDVELRVATALERARDENRRALVIWGSKGDEASQAFLEAVRKDRDVSRTLLYEYEVVRVDVGASRAPAAKYGANVQKDGLPYLTVLDQSGKVLANQATAGFRPDPAAATYDGAKVNEFLTKHQAPYLKAETLFTEALGRAKKEQKTLFVWFSAPW